MDVSEFEYLLPSELIAQQPLPCRGDSRMLCLDRAGKKIEHKYFRELDYYLKPGDTLVLNDTRVIPARLIGHRSGTGGKVEVFLVKKIEQKKSQCTWDVLVKPGKRVRPGNQLVFGEGQLRAEVLKCTEGGGRVLTFYYDGIFEEVLAKLGILPLPPYIKKQLKDSERYQTVYSRFEGSVAAPTAGLHFTPEKLKALKFKGVRTVFITLHVGLGTFRPVKTEEVEKHKMHEEYYSVSPEAALLLNQALGEKARIIAVGTTSCRVLETIKGEDSFSPGNGCTDIFIYPGYKFKAIDGLLTNFHLPRSTLIMLVSAFGGKKLVMKAYREAVKMRYRFYSFGDAMLIL
ncbi:tRNA preQ1(34) S-adenosylmethionine ribosyltransferase-isomerase QueA [Candidatus Contubernalis alkaliaceticus]|uniref:tRNA preQ1(34) S-adenosylmethionine ribosyltransferase-isomerase QueA n=1 Tax=Candidatus Contubernalis alkaliaceticus TaxID=338645 RepID=UPI001F4BD058|nr:tRNA preQ1(34) S-adenosylmethionine ribosyltransferase-isomerase QueA [Candidatus Contubernalis alkalaceticus]UNC92621.1 tRNA preQ1(34) S-adenosylmethionine ribosyltransferase-isomerase QueA [Candidatus Contubernalis alkalaceticus]